MTLFKFACCEQVEACQAGQVYLVEVVSSQGQVLSELVFNAQTGCLGANTLQVGWVCST